VIEVDRLPKYLAKVPHEPGRSQKLISEVQLFAFQIGVLRRASVIAPDELGAAKEAASVIGPFRSKYQ